MLPPLPVGGLGGSVAKETAATPYISIHRARLLRRATFHHIINTGGVLPPPSKNYNGVIREWQTSGRLHSQGQANSTTTAAPVPLSPPPSPPPIKPSLHTEQLSTAVLQGDTSNYS